MFVWAAQIHTSGSTKLMHGIQVRHGHAVVGLIGFAERGGGDGLVSSMPGSVFILAVKQH